MSGYHLVGTTLVLFVQLPYLIAYCLVNALGVVGYGARKLLFAICLYLLFEIVLRRVTAYIMNEVHRIGLGLNCGC